jgi:hypothetical protein
LEGFITVLVLAAVVVPIASIVGAVLAIGSSRRVRLIETRIRERDEARGDTMAERLARLEARVRALETPREVAAPGRRSTTAVCAAAAHPIATTSADRRIAG